MNPVRTQKTYNIYMYDEVSTHVQMSTYGMEVKWVLTG